MERNGGLMALQRDRTSFLHQVEKWSNAETCREVAHSLDRLIAWSQRQGLEFRESEEKNQSLVRFGFAANPFLVWSAYPRQEDGAKLDLLTHLKSQIPLLDQRSLAAQLQELPNVRPWAPGRSFMLPFNALFADPNAAKFEQILGWILDRETLWGLS